MEGKKITRYKLVQLINEATHEEDQVAAHRKVVAALGEYINKADVSAAINAHLRVHGLAKAA